MVALSIYVRSQEPCGSDIELPDSKDDVIEEMLSLKGLIIAFIINLL